MEEKEVSDTLTVVKDGQVRVMPTEASSDAAPAADRAQRGRRARFAKRAVDVIIASLVLLVALPLMAVIALIIRLESPGPVFYRASRVGAGGARLWMLKFRKMDASATGNRLTTSDDPRFTRIGQVLARTRLDELPQFWHVLRGEMSLVGPRPEDPSFVAVHPTEFDEILRVRPGLTGLSQLAFAHEARILKPHDPVRDYCERILPQKVALDRMYAKSGSVSQDLLILIWTFVVVALRREVAVNRASGKLSQRRRPVLHLVESESETTESAPGVERFDRVLAGTVAGGE